ncbi:unnamed protein product [Brachionus calyciflorus]|uniref:TIR domain-containing protein n=1 Tax=Brachionus calyciflorus TaxID=104777 RepID=A0A813MAR6_9BILA|nr:unnamed protein product [Brachionus calyciflorus]
MEEENVKLCNIFISYQWKSQSNVKKIYAELEALEGLNVFMDIYKIKAGNNLYASLASNIQQADVILACVSRDYVKSKNCEREIIYADAFNKPIIPLYIEKIPIPELGSIGFVLVRERFCSFYRNQNVFENFSESVELKDLLDGIYSIIKNKSIPVATPLKKKTIAYAIDEENVSQAVVNFRIDLPLDQPSLKPSSSDIQSQRDSKDSKKIESVTKKAPKLPLATNKNNSFNFLEIHPVIKELKFLIHPNILLDPVGDRGVFLNNSNLKRGGESYYPPVGWIRYGLNVKLIFNNNTKWLAKDGNKDEWAVVYNGFKNNPMKIELNQKLIDPFNRKFKPQLKKSNNLEFTNTMDVNPNSDGFNKSCDIGIICSAKPEIAEMKTDTFVLNNKKYKMLLQCRANPTKIRIPQTNKELRIINSPVFIRPYGILLKEI